MNTTLKRASWNALSTVLGIFVGGCIVLVGAIIFGAFYIAVHSHLTFVMWLFFLCLIWFGPMIALIPAIIFLLKDWRDPRVLAGMVSAFLCTLAAAYLGWYYGGMCALSRFPDYPRISPGELRASLYALPGFFTGAAAAALMVWLHSRPAYWKALVTLFVTVTVTWLVMASLLLGRMPLI